MTKTYLLGALHDATERKTTYRIGQKSQKYINFLAREIRKLGRKAWVYREGKSRKLFIVEFSKSLLKGVKIKTKQDKIDYIRGYFDAEGGIARSPIHNPSRKADPNYWRFYVCVRSYKKFAQIIGSWHPVKNRFLRMKI